MLIFDSFSTKLCFRLHRWCFSSWEKELFSWTYNTKKDTTKILKIWDVLFGAINIEVQCSKNKLTFFLQQETGAFGNNIGKESQKPRPRLKNMYIITVSVCSACNPMQVVVFCKFSHFEVSIIPYVIKND